jgi:photosystem II stability/assembly factor-like uncharacterized protein
MKYYYILVMLVLSLSTPYAQTNGWRQLPGPYGGRTVQVEIAGNKTIYALSYGKIYFKPDGKPWSVMTIPQTMPTYYTAVTTNVNGDLFYFNTQPDNSSKVGVFRSSDNGATWTKVLVQTAISKIIQSKSGRLYAFRGSNAFSTTTIFRSLDNGITWDSLSSIPLKSYDFVVDDNDICYFSLSSQKVEVVKYDPFTKLYDALSSQFLNSGPISLALCKNKVIVRNSNTIFTINPAGVLEKQIIIGLVPSKYQSVNSLKSDGEITYTISELDSDNTKFKILYSTDIGKSWSQVASFPNVLGGELTNFSISSGDLYLVNESQSDAGIYKTSNHGISWEQVGVPYSVTDLQEGPGNTIISDFVSADNGMTWENSLSYFAGIEGTYGFFGRDFDNGFLNFSYRDVFYANASPPYTFELQNSGLTSQVVPTMSGVSKNKFYALMPYSQLVSLLDDQIIVSSDHGISWDQLIIPKTATKLSSMNVSPNGAIYLGFTPSLYRSTDEGQSWTKLYTGIKNAPITTIRFLGSDTIYLGTVGQGIWRSTNEGLTFERWQSEYHDTVSTFELFHDRCYVVSLAGIISCPLNSDTWKNEFLVSERVPILKLLKTTNDHLYASATDLGVWINDPSAVSVKPSPERSKTSLQISNTPTSKLFSANFTLENSGYISIDLYYLLGRKLLAIAEGNFDAGEHQIPFSTASLANGMYCVVLTTPSGSTLAKMLVNH